MQVGRRQRSRQALPGLVGQRGDVVQGVPRAEGLHLGELAAAADEQEMQAGIAAQFEGSREQRVQGMAGAVVAGIHHHKLAVETVLAAEGLAALRIEADAVIMRPGRVGVDDLGGHALGAQARRHEPVQGQDARRAAEAPALQPAEQPLGRAARAQPARGHRLVRVQVHDPGHHRPALQRRHRRAEGGDQRRRRQADGHVKARQPQQDQHCVQPEHRKVGQPPPLAALAQPGRPDAADVDAAPGLAHRKPPRWIIVAAAGSHHGHLMPGGLQAERQIGQMLRRRHVVRVEALVEQKHLHRSVAAPLPQRTGAQLLQKAGVGMAQAGLQVVRRPPAEGGEFSDIHQLARRAVRL